MLDQVEDPGFVPVHHKLAIGYCGNDLLYAFQCFTSWVIIIRFVNIVPRNKNIYSLAKIKEQINNSIPRKAVECLQGVIFTFQVATTR